MIFFSYMYMVQHSVGIIVYFCYNTEYNKALAKSIDKVINTHYSLWNKKYSSVQFYKLHKAITYTVTSTERIT